MKKLILFISLFSAAGLLTSAPRHSGGSDSGGVEQQLMQMERDWAKADLNKDSQGIDRFESDEFVYNIDGMTGTKKDDLADAKNGAFTADSLEETEMTVRVFGNAAVVTGKAILKNAMYKGKDVSGDYLFTDTWVKKDGRWQIVASHSSKVQKM